MRRPSHLCREVAAELEFLERNGHGVGAEEEDEGHEGQVGNILTGLPHQHAAKLHAVFLTHLSPVEVRQVKLRREKVRKRRGEEDGTEMLHNGLQMLLGMFRVIIMGYRS